MPRLFVSSQNIHEGTITITDAGQLHHLKDVLRTAPGKIMVVVDENKIEYLVRLEAISAENAKLKIMEKKVDKSKTIDLTVAVAIPKKAKFDDIVDKLTQLGVRRIIPMTTRRTIVKIEQSRVADRLRRWEKIAGNAAEQSQRNDLPLISPVTQIEKIVDESADFDLKLIPALPEKSRTLKAALAGANPKSIIVLIGPEGDFTAAELKLCQGAGFVPVTLGKRVLRVETAAVAVAGYIMLNAPAC